MSRHVLVVDDDPSIRAVVQDILDMEGCEVASAANGREAVDHIQRTPPGVVLLDMNMPVLDGWGVARELKERGIDVPIVVMTAAVSAQRSRDEIGAIACLAKPFDLDDLLDAVMRFVDCPPCG